MDEIVKKLEKIKQWPEPQEGAGESIGPLAGWGMYTQYDFDRNKHLEEIQEIIDYIKNGTSGK